jgi:electron transport complex protein RnfG
MTHQHGAVVAPEAAPGTSSARLVATLGGAGALAGLLLVLVFRATSPAIEANRAATLQQAIAEVLRNPPSWDTLYLQTGALTKSPSGDRKALERAYLSRSSDGEERVAIQAGAPGFADVITVMLAMNPADGSLLGMKVIAQKETPGLGDKIEKDSAFVQQFGGTIPPLKSVKAGSRKPPAEVDAITGATISSRTVTRIINDAVARWRPLVTTYLSGAGQ